MAGFGGQNPFPMRFGGGPSDTQKMLRALRSTLGGDDSNAMGPQGGLEDFLRLCRARVMAASARAIERAWRQALPHTATDHMGLWADRLGVHEEATMVATRAIVVAEWQRRNRSDQPTLREWLLGLSPFLDVASTPWLSAKTTVNGLALANARIFSFYGAGSQWPNFSSKYLLRVTWDAVAAGEASPGPELRRTIGSFLNLALPTWVDWQIQQKAGPFYLDGGPDGTSVLDLTPMG